MIYSRNFAAGEARAGVTFPALPRGWQPPCPLRVGEHPVPARGRGPGGQGLCKDTALLLPCLPPSPLLTHPSS